MILATLTMHGHTAELDSDTETWSCESCPMLATVLNDHLESVDRSPSRGNYIVRHVNDMAKLLDAEVTIVPTEEHPDRIY